MGARFPSVQSNTIVNTTLVTSAETVLCVTPPFTPSLDFSTILILCRGVIVFGTGTSFAQARIRRGTTISGTLVQVAVGGADFVAGNTGEYVTWYFDNPGAVAGQQYCFTMVQGGATANGVCSDAAMFVFAL